MKTNKGKQSKVKDKWGIEIKCLDFGNNMIMKSYASKLPATLKG